MTVAGAIDREADGASRDITVRATSADGSFTDQVFTIAINDLDEFDTGAVTDTSGAGTGITADLLTVTAAGPITVDTSVNSADLSVTAACAITMTEVNAVTLTDVDTTNGTITVTAGGAITVTDLATGGNANATLSGTDLSVALLTVGTGDATLTATTGSITDASGVGTGITADQLTATAAGSITVDTAINTADLSAATGIVVTDAGALDLLDVDTTGGAITVTATGALTVTDVQSAGGNITLTGTSMTVTLLSAGTGNATLTASTGGVNGTAGGATDVIANLLTTDAAGGISLETNVTTANLSTSAAGANSLIAAGGGGNVMVAARVSVAAGSGAEPVIISSMDGAVPSAGTTDDGLPLTYQTEYYTGALACRARHADHVGPGGRAIGCRLQTHARACAVDLGIGDRSRGAGAQRPAAAHSRRCGGIGLAHRDGHHHNRRRGPVRLCDGADGAVHPACAASGSRGRRRCDADVHDGRRQRDFELLWVGRAAVLAIAVIAFWLGLDPDSRVLSLVAWAWAGFGAAFGPAIILSLYWERMTRNGALAGIVVGGLTVIVWPQLEGELFALYELVPGFVLSWLAIWIVSFIAPEAAARAE